MSWKSCSINPQLREAGASESNGSRRPNHLRSRLLLVDRVREVDADDVGEKLTSSLAVVALALGVGLEVVCSADYMWKGRGRWSIPVDRRPTGLTISSAHHRVDSMEWPA